MSRKQYLCWLRSQRGRPDKTSQFEIMKQVRKILLDYPQLRTAVQPVADLQQGGAANFQFKLRYPRS